MTLTMVDFFCGAGGSSTGAMQVEGVELVAAANHWDVAIDTHAANHPDAEHICADISQYDPRLVPRTDMAWLSPSCTKHSVAQGKKRADQQPDLFGEVLPDAAAERSRATMWDVVRMAEHHRYKLVFVENVVEVTAWPPYRAWLSAMESLGYEHHVLMLNSMHAQVLGPGAPQSRDRFYAVFWQRGNQRPDLERLTRPRAVCPECGPVESVQSWKRPGNTIGKYRAQYVYRCPNVKCRNQIVEPVVRPAADIIEWDRPGTRIGDRPLREFWVDKAKTKSLGLHPLAPKTLARIRSGIERYWGSDGLVVPVEGRDGKQARPVSDPLRTATARNETGLAFIAELRGGSSDHRPVTDPLSTVTASGNHHGLVTSYYGKGGTVPTSEALPTITTVEKHGLVTPAGGTWRNSATPTWEPVPARTTVETDGLATGFTGSLDDVRFRMFEPAEYKRSMDFPESYVMLGNRRIQVRLAGNAVCPPNARDLIGVAVESLG